MTPTVILDKDTPMAVSVRTPTPEQPGAGLYHPLRTVTGWHLTEPAPSPQETTP